MLRLSLITDEASQNLREAVGLAQAYGLDAVEIRSVEEKGPFEFTPEDVAAIRSVTKAAGLPVCCISSPFFKCELDDPEEIAAHIQGLKRCIEYAQTLECGLIRGFTFWARDAFDVRIDEICARFEEPVRLLEQSGITLALEFDPTTYATNGRKIARIAARIDSPYVRVLWDPGNDIYDPDGETPYPDGYDAVKEYIAHIHLKDAVRRGQTGEAVPMCRGEVDYAGQLRRLLADGYTGCLSLETHYRQKAVLPETLLQMPKGSAFSAFGYESSAECLENIRALLRTIE
ncbi:MAG: sugar phosphate isomerase/epimerase family protein [Hominenteromicrobium sp.]